MNVHLLFSQLDDTNALLSSDLAGGEYVAVAPAGSLDARLFKAQVDGALPPCSVKVSIAFQDVFCGAVDVRKVDPVTLDRVWVVTDEIESVSAPKGTLVRQGGWVSGGLVKLCEPVGQGVVGESTKITFIKSDRPGQYDCHHDSRVLDDTGINVDADVDVDLDLDTNHDQNLNLSLTLSCFPHPSSQTLVSVGTLSRLSLFAGDSAVISSPTASRVVTLAPGNTSGILLSPILFYNLGSPSVLKISPLTTKVPVATQISIARVASQVSTDRTLQTSFLAALRNHFEHSPQIIAQGDLLPIPIDSIAANSSNSATFSRPNTVSWFKIVDVQGPPSQFHLVDPLQSRMIQSGITTAPPIPTSIPWRQALELPVPFVYDKKIFPYSAQLIQLLSTATSPFASALHPSILVHSSKRGTGKATLLHSVAASLAFHLFEIDAYSILAENDPKTFGVLQAKLDRATQISPCLVLIKHLDAIAKKSDTDGKEAPGIAANVADLIHSLPRTAAKNGCVMVVAATAADVEKLSDSVRAKFTFELEVPVPDEAQRLEIFRYVSRTLSTQKIPLSIGSPLTYTFSFRNDVHLPSLALQSAGLTPPDLLAIIHTAKQKAVRRADLLYLLSSSGTLALSPADLDLAISDARRKHSDAIGAPRIPNVAWTDVGGLDHAKSEILDTIELPLRHPQLFANGVKKRSGILFYGPPGTGKTLLAKAIATTFSLNFFSVKGPELLNMYIGESEANVRRVFQKARDAKPCVVFFDELDSVAPKRGNQGDSGGVMDRIVSQLLAELDGMGGPQGSGVFVVGATNRPDLLDEALLRPGRFDKMVYLGVSDTREKQRTVLEALTRKFVLDGVDLGKVAEGCPYSYTGADFYAMCSDAMLNAMTRTAGQVDQSFEKYNEGRNKKVSLRWWFERVATPEDTDVKVTFADFEKSKREMVPSVSAEELAHYQRVRDGFQGGRAKIEAKPEVEPEAKKANSEMNGKVEEKEKKLSKGKR